MPTRGRLIWPFKAEIARLSQEGTAADPDGAGPLTSGYDPVFREPIKQAGVVRRVELDPIMVPCQVEDRAWEALMASAGGDDPRIEMTLVFHFRDLERMGLVDATTGDALIRKNDRLVAIRDYRTEAVIQSVTTPPGLYVTQALPRSYGLSGLSRNLLAVTFESREQSVRTL